MITDQDIIKLKRVFATKEELADPRLDVGELKDRVGHLEKKMDEGFDNLHVKIDRFLGTVDGVQLDNKAGAAILYRHEMNFTFLAKQLGIILPT